MPVLLILAGILSVAYTGNGLLLLCCMLYIFIGRYVCEKCRKDYVREEFYFVATGGQYEYLCRERENLCKEGKNMGVLDKAGFYLILADVARHFHFSFTRGLN